MTFRKGPKPKTNKQQTTERKNMRKIWIAASLAGLLIAPNVFAALTYDGTLTMTDPGGGKYHVASATLGNFDTFCIEHVEFFYSGSQYDYIVNSGAVKGNGGFDTTDPNTGLNMDTVSIGTAWLYSQFRAGNANYQNASLMHDAIWYLEQEGGSANTYYNNAKTALGLNDAQIMANQGGAHSYGVVALNLFNGNGSEKVWSEKLKEYVYLNQDMLAIPEPTTWLAGAMLLLPFGASTIRMLRRNRVA